jgi:hypothetical protein
MPNSTVSSTRAQILAALAATRLQPEAATTAAVWGDLGLRRRKVRRRRWLKRQQWAQ